MLDPSLRMKKIENTPHGTSTLALKEGDVY